LELRSIRQSPGSSDQSIGHWDALLILQRDIGSDCCIAAVAFRAQPDLCRPQAVERALGRRRCRGLQPHRVRPARKIVEHVTDDLSRIVNIMRAQQDPTQGRIDQCAEVSQPPALVNNTARD
jgi:hypothetical protein